MIPSDFIAAFPAFKDVPVPDIQRHLDAATSSGELSVSRWGAQYNEGLGCWVAHRIVVETQHNSTQNDTALRGDVTSQVVGGVNVTRGIELLKMAKDNPDLRTTYGDRYNRLKRKVGLGAVAV